MQSARFISSRNASRTHGSSLREMGSPLDQERAASMADEGGMAGAIMDARAQEASLAEEIASDALARVGALRRYWPWALLLGGAAIAAAAWQTRRAQPWYRSLW